jgi:hypothetical protein
MNQCLVDSLTVGLSLISTAANDEMLKFLS